MACCARNRNRNTYNTGFSKKKAAYVNATLVKDNDRCSIKQKDLMDLYNLIRKSSLSTEQKRALKYEVAVMSEKLRTKCPDEEKIKAIKLAIDPDGADSNT